MVPIKIQIIYLYGNQELPTCVSSCICFVIGQSDSLWFWLHDTQLKSALLYTCKSSIILLKEYMYFISYMYIILQPNDKIEVFLQLEDFLSISNSGKFKHIVNRG